MSFSWKRRHASYSKMASNARGNPTVRELATSFIPGNISIRWREYDL
jgi:hypothetical protein